MQHDWVPSRLGHGETMCRRYLATNREAAALGLIECDAPPPKPANENVSCDWSQDEIDNDNEYDDDDADDWLDMECGLAADGQCSQAGTEHCDFVCPNRNSEDFAGSAAWYKKHRG